MSFTRATDYEPQVQDKILGLFVIIACSLAGFAGFSNFFAQDKPVDWVELHTHLSQSYGLSPGTLAEVSGVTIGNIKSVDLKPDATVEISMIFDPRYAHLLREDSQLKIDSRLGLDTVLSGARLVLLPGKSDTLLADGSAIAIIEPKSIQQLLEEFQIDELATQVKTIIANVEVLTSTMANRQDDMDAVLRHVRVITGHVSEFSAQLPELALQLNQTNRSIQQTLGDVSSQMQSLHGPVTDLLASSVQTAQSLNQLSLQLTNHWLLSGNTDTDTDTAVPMTLAPDNSLYAAPITRRVGEKDTGYGRLR